MNKPHVQPTPAELNILQALWRRGTATVRELHEDLSAERESAYTTTLKFLQIMLEKGLVSREDAQRSHVYRAVVSEAEVQQALASDLMQRAFGGSAASLVLQALGGRRAKASDLKEIRKVLDQLEGKRK